VSQFHETNYQVLTSRIKPSVQLEAGHALGGRGFTLIELLVVMAIIATLLTIALPRYFHSVEKAKEAVLRQNLSLMRDAIDKHYGDSGKYPDSLETLVSKRYLRNLPEDPITESTSTWVTLPPDDPEKGAVYDVHSGAPGNSFSGTPYREW
jgi:general secretion pathway protein G